MTDTLDNQEIDEPIEEPTDETALNSLETVVDELEFLRSDNLNFYLAFKAYYDDQNYQEAIEKFQAVVKQELPAEDDPIVADSEKEEYLDADQEEEEISSVVTKSMYWLGEARIKIGQIDKAIEAFEQLASRFDTHHLGIAAQRRVEALKANYQKQKESM